MRTFYSEALTARELYRLITGAIVPRPVAWVSTIDASGTTNLAPFSFFTCVSTDPPLLAITMAPRSGQKKDTLRNIELNGEFVVNIASDSLAHPMSVSAGDFPYGRSEFVEAGLTPAPSELIARRGSPRRRSRSNAGGTISSRSARARNRSLSGR